MSSQVADRTWALLKDCEVLDVDGLTNSARQSFAALETWYTAERKGHRLVVKTTEELVQGSEKYFDAISASIEMAKTGRRFADEAAALDDRLAKGSVSTKDFRRFVTSMLKIASLASQQAQLTEDQFGEVRTSLIQVCGNVQSHLARVGAGEQEINKKGPRTRDITAKSEMVVVKSRKISFTFLRQNHLSLQDAGAQLCKAQADLDVLLTSVSHFCNWWAKIATELGVIEAMTPDMSADGSDTLPSMNVQGRWEDVGKQYNQYVRQVKLIEQLHPQLIQARKSSGCIIC